MGRGCRKGSGGGWPFWTPPDGVGKGLPESCRKGSGVGWGWAGMGVGMGMGDGGWELGWVWDGGGVGIGFGGLGLLGLG